MGGVKHGEGAGGAAGVEMVASGREEEAAYCTLVVAVCVCVSV